MTPPSDSIDLTSLPEGATYSDTYGAWLEVFRRVAEGGQPVRVLAPPRCWVPLLLYLGAEAAEPVRVFECDDWIARPAKAFGLAVSQGRQREYVEHVCALRPELVDALWKSDREWRTTGRRHTTQSAFPVASYSALYRPELLRFMAAVDRYEKPTGVSCAVITNCSAEKPYPARLHEAILERLPSDEWHLLIATGVLGVVPQELWAEMPQYDSGLPNFWRCMERWESYLLRSSYARLVVYTEFYSRALHRALSLVAGRTFIEWVVPAGPFSSYLPLLADEWLGRLQEALR